MTVEEYAKATGQLHPECRRFLWQYFIGFDLTKVRVKITEKNTSWLNTGVWVLGKTIIAEKGKLNGEYEQWKWNASNPDEPPFVGYKNNSAIDLATVAGMVILAHECFHVQKWLSQPWWKSAWTLLRDFFRNREQSWHARSEWEREAIEFQDKVAPDIATRRGELKVFEGLR